MTATVCNFLGANVDHEPERSVAGQKGLRLVHSAAATDDQLLADVCNGDQQAFAELANRHFDQVYRVAWRVMGGPADAEDVAQEAFVKLWKAPGALRDGGAVRAWLVRVASNLAIDRLRRKQPMLVDELPDRADDRPDAETELARHEVSVRIDAAIAGLPERQRIALVLTYYEHMSNQQTGDIMQLSVDAVESLLSRARRNLKTALAGEWRDMLDELANQ